MISTSSIRSVLDRVFAVGGGGWRRLAPGIASAVAGVALAGCSLPLPQAQADPTKVYVLSAPILDAGAGGGVESGSLPPVRLRTVEIASYLRTRSMVVRRGGNELEFREFARWGEPLDQGVGRVLREELLARGVAGVIQGAARPSEAAEANFEVTVRVLAAEGNADGSVSFHVTWEIASLDDKPSLVAQGRYRPTDLRWTPKAEATLAAALSRGVSGLAGEIASRLKR